MGYCIIWSSGVHFDHDLLRPRAGHRHARARRARPGDGPQPAREAQRVQPGHARRPVPGVRPAGERRHAAGRRAGRARRALHRGPRPRRRRPRDRRGPGSVPRGRPRPVAPRRRLDQAGGRGRTGSLPDPRHRAVAGRRRQDRRVGYPVRADRDTAGHLPVRRRHDPAAAADRLGQRDAVAAHRRRVRRRRSAPDRADPGGGRRRRRGTGAGHRARAHHRRSRRPARCPSHVGLRPPRPHPR